MFRWNIKTKNAECHGHSIKWYNMKNGKYILVNAPNSYPGKKYRGRYCYEHHLIYWEHYGIVPMIGEVVHHINEDTTDNRIENLILINKKDHDASHSNLVIPVIDDSKHVTVICAFCGNEIDKYLYQIKNAEVNGQVRFYCNRSHMVKHYHQIGLMKCGRKRKGM